MSRRSLRGTLLLLLASAAPAADVPPPAAVPGESRPTAARLAEARKKLDDKRHVEAIDELQAILSAAGNDLAPLTSSHSVQARRLCHQYLAGLPPEALREYRARVDARAKKQLDEALATRDVPLLRKLVDEAFCSRPAETALDALGDLAFERGRFDEALYWQRLLARPLGAQKQGRDGAALVYPDPQGGLARPHAKQVLTQFFAGDREGAACELKAYRAAYPDAEGTLAGRKGRYADLLQEILTEPNELPATEPAWSTFGGDATRGRVLPAPPRWSEQLARTVREGPTWRFNLEARARLDDDPPTPGRGVADSARARALAFHPLIVGRQVLVSDARFVTAYDLDTGKASEWYDVTTDGTLDAPNLRLPARADLRYTMTVADDCLYVRLGAQEVFCPDEPNRNDPERARKEAENDKKIASFLACLSLKPKPNGERRRWRMRPLVFPDRPASAQRGAIFEGAPVVRDGLLYVAATWFEGERTLTAILCYPAGTEQAPPLRWKQVVCETQELRPKDARPRHHLLTVAGPNVVYCSHSGAVVAVDALTGKPAWAVRYPSRPATNADEPSLRDLAPCLSAAGRLYVAPADHDGLLCLDPATGQTLWERERIRPTQLLGVGQGRLIFTTRTGLRALNAADGGDDWLLPDGGGTCAPMGRGFLIGDVVVWPTTRGVFVRRQADGQPTFNPTLLDRVPPGNLAYDNGVLAVADQTTLSVFVPPDEPTAPAPAEKKILNRRQGVKPREPVSRPPPSPSVGLVLPLKRVGHFTLAAGETIVSPEDGADQFLTAGPDRTLARRSAVTGAAEWTRPLSFAPTWAADDAERVVAAGPRGLAAVRRKDGEPIWEVAAAALDPVTQPRGKLGAFQLVAGRVYFLQGECRLFAVDAATGKTLWDHWAPGALLRLPAPLGRFHPAIVSTAKTVLVQPTPGRLWLLDAATGKVVHQTTNRAEPWPRPPIVLERNRFAVVGDTRTVALLDADSGKEIWKQVAPGVSTLSGEAPQLAVSRDALLLLTPTNLGDRLQRLDEATGKPLWPKAALLDGAEALDAAGWSFDRDAVYYVQDRLLSARSLADGRLLWQQPVAGPDGAWRTRRSGDAVLAYPAASAAGGIQFRWLGMSVQWNLSHAREAGVGRGLPVVCCDPPTGQTVQRLNLVAGPPRVQTSLEPAASFALTPCFQTTPAGGAAPRVRVTGRELLIAFGAQVWRFAPAEGKDAP